MLIPRQASQYRTYSTSPRTTHGPFCRDGDGALRYTLTRRDDRAEGAVPSYIRIISSAAYREHEIARYENGAIRVLRDEEQQQINVKGFLRPIAAELGITTESEARIRLNPEMTGLAQGAPTRPSRECERD
jgi:hypothetical protein